MCFGFSAFRFEQFQEVVVYTIFCSVVYISVVYCICYVNVDKTMGVFTFTV